MDICSTSYMSNHNLRNEPIALSLVEHRGRWLTEVDSARTNVRLALFHITPFFVLVFVFIFLRLSDSSISAV